MSGDPALDDRLGLARDALARRDWQSAFDLFRSADSERGLSPDDLEGVAKSAWWTGRPNESIEARERAYAAYVQRGDPRRAAFMALTLRREHAAKLAGSVAQGWLNRAERLLEGEPDSPFHGYLAIAHGELAWHRGELEHALSRMEAAVYIANRFDDADLKAWAAMRKGMVLVDRGKLDEGWALMEEVSAAAVGGELGPYTTGAVFCNVISMCRDLADYRRGKEWSDAAKRWCERQAIAGFPGICRVHRAEVMRLLGDWAEAEQEVRRACDELYDFNPAYAAAAYHELGEVRLRMGDLAAAEAAFAEAHELGEDPQPGWALLRLSEGKVAPAAASIRRSLEDEPWNRLARARLLPAQAEIARAAGDAETLRSAADELASISEEFGTPAITAAAAWAWGLADLVAGDAAGAIRSLRRASHLWREVDAPYEAAKVAVALAEAYLAEGDAEAAGLELRTARSAFERLGAIPDARGATSLLERATPSRAEGARAVRTFMVTDIVGSTALIEAIGDEAWEDIRGWHDQSLRTCFAEHGGEEIDHAGDGFFLAFPDAGSAIECATAIQLNLAEHRRTHGFAPQIRIGLHATEAMKSAGKYTGKGVHAAARIGGVAQGGEILASEDTVKGVEGLSLSERREITFKGIARPVSVVSIDWR